MIDLLNLYKFYSVHGTEAETAICDWLVERIKQLGKDVQRDGNTIWYFGKGNRYLLSAHLDQVATNGPAVNFFKTPEGIIKAYNKDWERTSLGADDKNGIWCILKLLEQGKDFDFIISEGEEVGCIGIEAIEEHIVESEAQIAIVIDRKGNTDILKGGGSDVYCDTLAGTLRNFWNTFEGNNYSVTTGTLSDTRVICKYKESVNLCANYENAHTKNEETDFNGLQRTLQNLLKLFDNNFIYYPSAPSTYIKETYTYNYKGKKKKNWWDSEDYDLYRGGHYYGEY